MDRDSYDDLLNLLEEEAIASRESLIGCTSEEIEILEQRYGIKLPKSYRQYLEQMGHESGRLFTHDHLAVFYPYVLEMTAEERQYAAEEPGEKGIELPDDALIILGRLSEHFEFIRCNDPNDSPVWYYRERDFEIKQAHATVLEWLFGFADEAKEAIGSGYYDTFPDGTFP